MFEKAYKYIVIALIGIFIIGISALITHFNDTSKRVIEENAINDAKRMANALKIMRSKYTSEVVGRVKKQQTMNITHEYEHSKYDTLGGAIPLPATLSMDIAKSMSTEGTEVSLYSKYPFPWRKDRQLTDFQSKAWDYFVNESTSATSFYEFDRENNVLKYAIPDKMQVAACVNCHNQHPKTPKSDWKLGDTRGVISIVRPLKKQNVVAAGNTKTILLMLFIVGVSLAVVIVIFIKSRRTLKAVEKINVVISQVEQGDLPDEALPVSNSEIGVIAKGINSISDYLKKAAQFAQNIGQGTFESNFEAKSEKDILGKSLINMKDNLIAVKEEDKKRNWSTEGIAKLGEILRNNNDNIEKLSDNIISYLVKYLKANQGGIFIVKDNEQLKQLELTAMYAYERKKYLTKEIEYGEGLIGRCWQEEDKIFMTDVPEDYISITSGLGDANPRCILIVPLKVNEVIYGVMELASFKVLEEHEIDFVEKVSESIASTVSSVKVNTRTATLLAESQEMSEQLQAQEEELRQNAEEMQATQEEMERKIKLLEEKLKK